MRRNITFFVGAILVIFIIFFTVRELQKQQEIRSRAGGETASLMLIPDTASKAIGESFQVTLYLNTKIPNVSGVDIVMQLQPNLLDLNFQPDATFNEKLVDSIDATAGTFRYVAVDTSGQTVQDGNIPLGTFTVKGKSQGTVSLTFTSVQIVALGNNEFLTNANNTTGVYSITESVTPIQSPTETPVSTIQPSPTITQLPTETPILTSQPPLTGTNRIGDANKDGQIDILDFNIWRNEFLNIIIEKSSDFNNDGAVDLLDFNIWRNAFLGI